MINVHQNKTARKKRDKSPPTTGDARVDQLQAENARLREALDFLPTGMKWAIRKAKEIADGDVRRGLSDSELLLGSMMLGEVSAAVIAQILGGSKLKPAALQFIFEIMVELDQAAQPTDAVTVSGVLEERDKLGIVGGLSYLGTLARDTPTDCKPFEVIGRILRGEP
jgi:hypothetical protein